MFKIISNFIYSHKDSNLVKSAQNTMPGKIAEIFLRYYRYKKESKYKNKCECKNIIKSYYDLNRDNKKVLLIQLPLPENYRHKRIIPIGIAQLASYCHTKIPDLNICILDAQVNNLSMDEIVDAIIQYDWFAIGITYWTIHSYKAKILSKTIKKMFPATYIIHGGVHATVSPEEVVDYADFIITHEGEETLAELLGYLIDKKSNLDSIKGLIYKKDDKVINTGFRPLIDDLNKLPPPALELLPIEKYKMPLHVTGQERLPIIGSRGCPFSCSFCVSPLMWKRKVRWRDPEVVVEEMKSIKEKYNISSFHFWDDNLTLNRDYIIGLCDTIINQKLNFSWVGLDRAELINKNKDILPLMKQSGCIGMEIGVESANPDTFSYITKKQSLDDTRNAIYNLKNSGIAPLYTCMAFNPGETINGYYLQKDFLDEIQKGLPWYKYFHPFPFPVYVGQFSTPYPKTQFGETIHEKGIVLCEDPEYLYHHQINFIPYSLLEDIPVRNMNKLNKYELYICLIVIKQHLYPYFKLSESPWYIARKISIVYDYAKKFYSECNGWLTIKQLAIRLRDEYNMSINKSYRLCAFLSYIMGQMGWIKSAIHERTYEIKPKYLDIPREYILDIEALLTLDYLRRIRR